MDGASVSALADLLKHSEEEAEARRGAAPPAPAKGATTLVGYGGGGGGGPPATPGGGPSAAPGGAPGAAGARARAPRDAKAVWAPEEVLPPGADDPSDGRPRPDFDVRFKQSVGSEDVFFGLGDKSPASAHCDTLVVVVRLPATARAADISLDVTDERIVVATPTHRLATYLPERVRAKAGSAAWDAARRALSVTLPLDREPGMPRL